MSQRMGQWGARAVRVWLDELPHDLQFECARMSKGPTIAAQSSSLITAIAVEMASLSNHWQYAQLGGRFEAASESEFRVEACIGSRNETPPEWLLAQPSVSFGTLTIGISEMNAGLVAYLPTQLTEISLPGGVLHVNCAVESEVATSRFSISVATFQILQTLARGTLPADENELLNDANAAWRKAISLWNEVRSVASSGE